MKKTILLFTILLASCAGNQTQEIRTVERLSTASRNDYYVSNRTPLQPQQFIKLPAGSIEPEGWIRRQIELQKDGLCGHLGEISAWLQKGDNAWLKNGGEWGWEEVPYWLRGYGNMAYALKDETLLKETKFWIDAILASQRTDGNFGPVHLNNGKQDFWPNMIVLWIMQSYHEYTNDSRVIDFMTAIAIICKRFPTTLSSPVIGRTVVEGIIFGAWSGCITVRATSLFFRWPKRFTGTRQTGPSRPSFRTGTM